ncbi:hypothetical protein PI125_g19218 [Phytophthora idaei]|nr:hypothetical protein PI125_g19218 [Phytophthora idaei]
MTKINSVLVVNGTATSGSSGDNSVVYAALQETERTLMELHKRLGHLIYDAVGKKADEPRSGVVLTDHKRFNCLTCAKDNRLSTLSPTRNRARTRPSAGMVESSAVTLRDS